MLSSAADVDRMELSIALYCTLDKLPTELRFDTAKSLAVTESQLGRQMNNYRISGSVSSTRVLESIFLHVYHTSHNNTTFLSLPMQWITIIYHITMVQCYLTKQVGVISIVNTVSCIYEYGAKSRESCP
jgi:hypothetical protein